MAWFLYDNGLRHERVNYHESLSGNAKMYFFRFSLYYRATSGFSFSLLMILIHPTILMFITHPDIHQRGLGKFYIGFTKFTLNISLFKLREKFPYSEFFLSVFCRIRAEYGEIFRIFSYSVRLRENTNQKISENGHFRAVSTIKLAVTRTCRKVYYIFCNCKLQFKEKILRMV